MYNAECIHDIHCILITLADKSISIRLLCSHNFQYHHPKVIAASRQQTQNRKMRQPGIEPGPLPWKGRILTIRPLTLVKGMTLCTYHDTS